LASKITSGKPFSSSNKKSIKPFFVDSKSSPKASMSFWVSFTFGSSEIFACPFSLSKIASSLVQAVCLFLFAPLLL